MWRKNEFISSQEIASVVKLELKSYFDAQAVEDILFPRWIKDCLEKLDLGVSSQEEAVLKVENFMSTLPDDFYAARAVYLTTELPGFFFPAPTSVYNENVCNIVKLDSNIPADCPPEYANEFPDLIRVVYKINDSAYIQGYKKTFLLKPRSLTKHKRWKYIYGDYCTDSFDIHGNKIITTFREGIIYMVYYAFKADEDGYPMMPDMFELRKYIENYLKYKVFELLSNQVTDETIKIVMTKLEMYKREADEDFIICYNELKKPDYWKAMENIIYTYKHAPNLRLFQLITNGTTRTR